jgi:hypothetical protein
MPVSKKERSTSQTTLPKSEPSSKPVPEQQEFHQHLRVLAQSAVRTVLALVMREELDAFIRAAWGECSPKRKGSRNGTYSRDLVTATGRIEEVNVPRDREGQFHTQTFERYSRYEPHIARSDLPRCLSPGQVPIRSGKSPKRCWASLPVPAQLAVSTRLLPNNLKHGVSTRSKSTGASCTWMVCISAFVMVTRPIPQAS